MYAGRILLLIAAGLKGSLVETLSIRAQNNNKFRPSFISKSYLSYHVHPLSLTRRFSSSTRQFTMADDSTNSGSTAVKEHERNTSAWVRSEFVSFFEKKGHTFWKSSPVVPHNDPTLLFANAGMNQFKDIIVGKSDESTPYGRLKRVCNSQKCIRAGGKHNDLDDVGRDSYHHTFFEMLGNWSFGDYFKSEAIDYAWELLTKVYCLDENRLYVTYFGGDAKMPQCPPDDEARQLWLKYLPQERILPFGLKDNFWEMADTGPCGPCSEIHYDHIGDRDAASLVNADDPTVVELWNLVFMQYNRKADGSLDKLPKPCVDTGMGLERVCAVLIKSSSNYDCDLFTDIAAYIRSLVPRLPAYAGTDSSIDVAYRVVADHARCLTIAIADGAEPSNEGRGYVLRRILRRAVRYAKEHLGATDILHKLVDPVIASLGAAYPEVVAFSDAIKRIIQQEEETFLKTLDKGVERFKRIVSNVNEKTISGDDAFVLYTSFGFPLDLTELMAREHGLQVDVDGFSARFKEHQALSEKRAVKVDDPVEGAICTLTQQLSADVLNQISKYCNGVVTDDSLKYKWSQSQEPTVVDVKAKVLAIYGLDGLCDSTKSYGVYTLVLDKTNFYAESGGQIWDVGFFQGVDDDTSKEKSHDYQHQVVRVQKMGGLVYHFCVAGKEPIKVGDELELHVDFEKRLLIGCNHTATHLLNFVLRCLMGNAAFQRGSKLDDQKFTFDFAANSPLDESTLVEIEARINDLIEQAIPVQSLEIDYKKAMKIPGIRAHFGETYPEVVRVIAVCPKNGTVCNGNADGFDGVGHSIELCGGTHVSNTATLKSFHILAEEGISKGIRRLTCVTNASSIACHESLKQLLSLFDEQCKSMPTYESVKADTDTGHLFKLASKNLKDLTSLKTKIQETKWLGLVEKRKLVAKLEALINDQNSIAKLHQKRLGTVAKNKAALLINDLKKGKSDGFLVKQQGPISVLTVNIDELEGDAKNLNVCVQTIAKAFENLAIVATSKSADGATTCRCTSPNANVFDALEAANAAAPADATDVARGTKTNASWTI